MKYPISCNTNDKKVIYLKRVASLLRLTYKAFNRWWTDGITQTQYDNMEAALANLATNMDVAVSEAQLTKIVNWIKNNYSFTPKLTQEQWESYLQKHEDIFIEATTELNIIFKIYSNDSTYEVEL